MDASSQGPYRMMICAPSNAAVDEITARLRKDGLIRADGSAFTPRVIRLGQSTTESDVEIRQCTLDDLVEQRLRDELSIARLDGIRQQLKDVTDRLRAKPSAKERHTIMLLQRSLHQQQTQMRKQIEQLRLRVRTELLLKADVLVCTLSGAGGTVLEEFVIANRVLFDAVIVDEAAQACEVSTLIPLRYVCFSFCFVLFCLCLVEYR